MKLVNRSPHGPDMFVSCIVWECRVYSNYLSFNVNFVKNSIFTKIGKIKFKIEIPLEYNNCPPLVKCETRIWHPNINEDGAVCLSILRTTSLDGSGWAPTRQLKDVIWGLSSLFADLCDFDDPLNVEAAEHFRKKPEDFKRKVKDYIRRYCT